MSKIPFNFDNPTPSYFRKNGWLKKPNTCAFVTWCFSRCSSVEREICHDNQKIILKPYQFIFGRMICVEETGLTEREVRVQQNSMEKAGYLKKAPNKTPNRFTIYEWMTEAFNKISDQQNDQQATNKRPTNDHNTDIQITDNNTVVVVAEKSKEEEDMKTRVKKTDIHGNEIICVQEEYFSYAVRKNKPWTSEEILSAWEILIDYPGRITNWYSLMDGIIKKNNTLHKKQEKKSCKIHPLNQKPEKHSEFYLEDDTKESPLAKFEQQMRSKIKS